VTVQSIFFGFLILEHHLEEWSRIWAKWKFECCIALELKKFLVVVDQPLRHYDPLVSVIGDDENQQD
jgi:hypothetical protein